MAKKSKVVKNNHRYEIVKRYESKRKKLKEIIKDPKTSLDEKRLANMQLEKLPRDSNPIRLRNRCSLTGRPRGYYRTVSYTHLTLPTKRIV